MARVTANVHFDPEEGVDVRAQVLNCPHGDFVSMHIGYEVVIFIKSRQQAEALAAAANKAVVLAEGICL